MIALVSDLHLEAGRPDTTAALAALLARLTGRVAAFYVLGDLFEAWVGDDDDEEPAGRVADALAALAASGARCYFQHGNRDFLLGERYAARCGLVLLPEAVVHELDGVPTLLMHGDVLCTADREYLAFRAMTRAPAWQQGFLAQPLAARRAFAAQARAESTRHTRALAPVVMDVDRAEVEAVMARHGVARMIHGHTHRPALHSFACAAGGLRERWVLGDWYARPSVLLLGQGEARLVEGLPAA